MVIQRYYWGLMHTSVVLTIFFFFNQGHVSKLHWLTYSVNCVFQRDRHMSSSEWLTSLR